MDHRDSRINKIVKAGFLPGLVLFLTALLYIWNLWNEGYANLYYAAGVRSMGTNLHAFFFNSLDSAGFVSIDKPPLGFWVQVLFTKVLGFTGFALLLPQALAGVICVGLVYRMVSRRSNPKAGLFAALVLALTPIFTAVSRNNTIDSTLILVLLLASEQAIRAVERSRFKHLVFAGIWIGLGFNIKMLAAYTFVPAVFLLYLFAPGLKFLKKAGHMVLAFLIMALISLSWVTAVDLTPESNRPYVGSSSSNSALDLALGYNGLNRLIRGLGRNSRPTGTAGAVRPPLPNPAGAAGQPLPNPAGAAGQPLPRYPANAGNAPGNTVNPMAQPGGEAGPPSIFRLLRKNNAGQISWFLLPALLTGLFISIRYILRRRIKDPDAEKIGAAPFLGLYAFFCTLTLAAYFSFSSGLAHRYYFSLLAPPVAILSGLWLHEVLSEARSGKFNGLFIASLAITAGSQLYIQSLYAEWRGWLIPVSAGIFLVAVLSVIKPAAVRFTGLAAASTLLFLPLIWSFTPIQYGNNNQLPVAGPELASRNERLAATENLSDLVDYLVKNRGSAKYLAAAPSAMNLGAPLILASAGEAVMVLGGFNGNDRILTVDEFASAVSAGLVKFAVVRINAAPAAPAGAAGNPAGAAGNPAAQENLTAWILKNGRLVPPLQWNPGQILKGVALYRLGP